MYFITQMTKSINDNLYRHLVPYYPELKQHLPLTSDITLDDVNLLIQYILTFALETNSFNELFDLKEFMMYGRSAEMKSELGKILSKNQKCIDSIVTSEFTRACGKSNALSDVANILTIFDKEACLVGGSVRDAIQDNTPKDFDFVTTLDYDRLNQLFASYGFTVTESGQQFLVLTVSKDGEDYEIACYRNDGTYVDGRRPESVSIGSMEEDAARRDFTVNALYYNLASRVVLDPTGNGIQDSLTSTLRFVGKPKDRLKDDYLRGIRFYRFVAKGFAPESKSLSAVRELFSEIIKKTSPERIRVELERIVKI
jgi:hypothetical protein